MMDMIYMMLYIFGIISVLVIGLTIVERLMNALPSLDEWMCKLLGCEKD